MDKIIVAVREGKGGLTAEIETTAPETSTLMERALASSVAARIPGIVAEEKGKLLKALQGVAGALSPKDKDMLEGKAKPPAETKTETEPKAKP
jgi:hypothetical protein